MPLILIPIALMVVPAVEIYVFIKVGQAIGAGTVLALLLLSAIVGAALLRFQSISVIRRLDRDLRSGRIPDGALFDGFLIVVGAILMIVPGFVSDVFGLLLMIPPVRRVIRHYVAAKVTVSMSGGFRRGFRRNNRNVVDLSAEDYHRNEPREPGSTTIDHKDERP